MLKNIFEAKMYLKMLLVYDRNNAVAESFEEVMGYKPQSAYEVITSEKYLSYCVDISKEFSIDDMGIEKDIIPNLIAQKLHSMYL